MKFHLARFADQVLPKFKPDNFGCSSFDEGSWEPTRRALFRLKQEEVLPAYSIPGSYASVVYEEADLSGCYRVSLYRARGKWKKPDPRELPGLRALAFVQVEAYLQGITAPYDEACTVVPGLLALPDILEPESRRALAEDMWELLRSPPAALELRDMWPFAVSVPALLRAAGGTQGELDAAQSAVEAMRVATLEQTLHAEFGTRAAVLEALSLCRHLTVDLMMQWLEWAPADDAFENWKPIWGEDYDTIFKLTRHWFPEFADRLGAPSTVRWPESEAVLEVHSHEENPLRGSAVSLGRQD